MADGLSTNQQLAALQNAAREVMPELGTNAEMNRTLLADMLTKEGYDLKNNNLESATRAWQHRNGLLTSGFDSSGGPDVVTLAVIAAKYDERLAKPATPEQTREFALRNLTEIASDRSNASKMDAVFEAAGLGGSLSPAVAAAPAAEAAAPAAQAAAPAAAAPSASTLIQEALVDLQDAVGTRVYDGTRAPAAATPELDAMGNPVVAADPAAAAAGHGHTHEHDHAAHASGDPLGDFIREKDKPAAAAGPDVGTRIGEGVDAARAAGGKMLEDAGASVGRAWDNVTGTFKKLGEKTEPTAEELAAKAEREAQLRAASDAISARAAEMRKGAGEMATGAMDSIGEGLRGLGDKLKKLGSDAPAAPDAGASTPAAAPAAAPAAQAPMSARKQIKFE